MKGMKCICGKIAEYNKNMKFNSYEIDGWECKSCGEAYYNPEKAEKILLINKLKKHKFYLKLSKVKSNLILRIPKEVGDALNLKKSQEVEFGIKDSNEIVIHPFKGS
ncbi:AbrB/MazE/SpoVT family DNA-binding domain-containing protein [Candidatus Woesearchaeota archaeon]|nr:AbrB/MazE/SpoVT family DNA-binding domain-containing protein [Candidatus Pacearchaeota archaeon]MBI4452345.1 AbrB/MazE/SpoVT family DNA-binding domain-containing protein [Candidatus Woesearchaeota archaeon]